jgi:hypothetical protein
MMKGMNWRQGTEKLKGVNGLDWVQNDERDALETGYRIMKGMEWTGYRIMKGMEWTGYRK